MQETTKYIYRTTGSLGPKFETEIFDTLKEAVSQAYSDYVKDFKQVMSGTIYKKTVEPISEFEKFFTQENISSGKELLLSNDNNGAIVRYQIISTDTQV